jgi:hypothetical protein
MSSTREDLPDRLKPHVIMRELNEPVRALSGPFWLGEAIVDSDLVFRWTPSPALVFDGTYSQAALKLDGSSDWVLRSDNPDFEVSVLLTSVINGPAGPRVQGVVNRPVSLGESPLHAIRFCLANFPSYIGAGVRYEREGSRGTMSGRLQVVSELGECILDPIPEARELGKAATRDAGWVVTHVGEWRPAGGQMTVLEAQEALHMLHLWFGFLRGAWAGPLFPQGLLREEVMWREFGAWDLDESRSVSTWMPQRALLDLSDLFAGYVRRWTDAAWKQPLMYSIHWLVEANSPSVGLEPTIVLSQVALEMLAWVLLVETEELHSRSDFRRLSAAGRMRILLQHIGVPTALPDYMGRLPSLVQGDAFYGPGVIARVRNALVHASEDNRAVTAALDGPTLFECSQLSLQYVDLAILAACGHTGYYARRAWRGWKGDDEVPVPWAATG